MGFCIPPQAPLHFLLPFIPLSFGKFTSKRSSFREDLPFSLLRNGGSGDMSYDTDTVIII